MSEKDEDKLATLKRDLASLQAKLDEYEKQRNVQKKKDKTVTAVKTGCHYKTQCSIM